MVDQQRYPVCYETPEVRKFLKTELKAEEEIRAKGIEFHRHYAAATACTPSRASLFTGQYPSLHGVSQTSGAAKSAFDADMFWLDPNTVPTMGDYFRAGGYRTFYKGKWHFSHSDLAMAGTHYSLPTCGDDGAIFSDAVDLYLRTNRLNGYGFDGWIGPEPHGSQEANAGIVRDPMFADQTIQLLEQLDSEDSQEPWLIVNSFVNPHDIVLYGLAWKNFPCPHPMSDPSVPDQIPRPETEKESLETKPRCQKSYVEVYPKALSPQPTLLSYRQFYYYLQQQADRQIGRVYRKLEKSRFFENTIVVFTSDHGELLGAHGGMHQKWHNAYEEAVHVPLVFSNPVICPRPRSAQMLTSHVDLLPTLLGLAEINPERTRELLKMDHTEVRPLVGRNLAPVVRGEINPDHSEPIYFMTDDEITSGPNQNSPVTGKPYAAVTQPNHVETVIAVLDGELWKYSRYFDNPQFWEKPFEYDLVEKQSANGAIIRKKPKPDPPEFEMYNVTCDPLEKANLAYGRRRNQVAAKEKLLRRLLEEQREKKRLYPVPYKDYAKVIQSTESKSQKGGRLIVAKEF